MSCQIAKRLHSCSVAAAVFVLFGFIPSSLAGVEDLRITEVDPAGDRVEVAVSPELKYTVEIRKIEKGTDDASLDISSY